MRVCEECWLGWRGRNQAKVTGTLKKENQLAMVEQRTPWLVKSEALVQANWRRPELWAAIGGRRLYCKSRYSFRTLHR